MLAGSDQMIHLLQRDAQLNSIYPPFLVAPYLLRLPDILGELMNESVFAAGMTWVRNILRTDIATAAPVPQTEAQAVVFVHLLRQVEQVYPCELAALLRPDLVKKYWISELTYRELYEQQPGAFLPPHACSSHKKTALQRRAGLHRLARRNQHVFRL